MSPLFLAFLASALASPVHKRAAPTCHEELHAACGLKEHDGTTCVACVTDHKATVLHCSAAEVEAFCKTEPPHPTPTPTPPACKAALIADCGKSTKGSRCLACADVHKTNLTKDGCTEHNVNAFCEAPKPPPTPAEKCEREEELLCGNDRHNKTLCTTCITLHAPALKNASCTETQTTEFCEHKPPPAPSSECAKVLEEYCEPERAMHNHTACVHCVDKHENQTKAAHCTYTQIEAFCHTNPTPPGPAPPVNHCFPAMKKACEGERHNVTKCKKCIEADATKLEKVDNCTETMLHEFCEPMPGPTEACEKEFRALCGQEDRNATECLKCEDEHEAVLKEAGCTVSALSELCHTHPSPSPPTPIEGCERALYKLCDTDRHNKTKCAACEVANKVALAAANCTTAVEEKFCAPGPKPPAPPHPVRPTCGEVLERECGADQKNATMCHSCVVTHAAVEKEYNCTAAEEQAFCAHKPPAPPTPTDKCRKVMEDVCEVDRHNKTKCVHCLEEHHNQTLAAKCTYTEEAAFCKVTPPRPPAPPSPVEECERALERLCDTDRHNKTKCAACETANKAALLAAHCTTTSEEHYCEAAPPRPPSPPTPTEECERELYKLCDTDRHNKIKCAACESTNKVALAAANCTTAVEGKFCEAGPKPPAPPAPANSCLKTEIKVCGTVRSSPDQCILCMKDHYNTTVAAHCTREEDEAFCKMTPAETKCFLALYYNCAAAQKTSKAACTGCERAHANTTKEAGCTVKEEDTYCGVTGF